MQVAELETRLLMFVRDELGVDDPDLDRETTLVSTGLVDSANLVRLAAFVERTANVQIPDRDIDAERFDTVGRIVAYVTERRGG